MDALLGTLTVTVLFLLLAAPALMGLAHERRIDRQLRAARPTQKSSSRSTVPSTATWYAEGRRSKKLVSS
ncbi:putative secreted protein [Streptomyces davaonensis JCM 4913]|uniref:Putative secreted protein n=1 Tax=Streptomyces davaonensis (strain DSM 101723 / JCM 4913 / KCC S-0913 / 768) TaxID=1214101 RepID=K4QU93_STRDJ|nr:putative secreted protein [Streptomyces davaonensis JCM 4913]